MTSPYRPPADLPSNAADVPIGTCVVTTITSGSEITVVNLDNESVRAPRVRVTLLDDAGGEVAQAFAAVTPADIPGQTQARFSARIENPPFESFELELSFVPADTAQAGTGPSRP